MATKIEEDLANVDIEIIDLANNMLKHLMSHSVAHSNEEVQEQLKKIIEEKGQEKYDKILAALEEYNKTYSLTPVGFVGFAADALKETFVKDDVYDDDFDEAYRLLKNNHRIIQIGQDRGFYTLIMQTEIFPGGTPEPVVEVEEPVVIVGGDWGDFEHCAPRAKEALAYVGNLAKGYTEMKNEVDRLRTELEELKRENYVLKLSSWQ